MARKKQATAPDRVYQIKVALDGSKPPIWRRLLVPSDLTLGDLHRVIQVAMGWTDSHLHQFTIAGRSYGVPHPDDMEEILDEEDHRLAGLRPAEKFKFRYEYDFGDSWVHTILVEKILEGKPGQPYPFCLKGKGACPPEDCGGIWGYRDFIAAMADPEHPEHVHYRDWYNADFDPEAFDLAEVNRILAGPG